jgi:hypothetical protein
MKKIGDDAIAQFENWMKPRRPGILRLSFADHQRHGNYCRSGLVFHGLLRFRVWGRL